MKHIPARIALIAFALGFAALAVAASPPILHGDVSSADGNTLQLKSASGERTSVKLADDVRVSVRVPAKLDDIKPNTFVGVAATPGPNGTLVASEVQIFPEALRGIGEGHRPMSNRPGSTMTNATVSNISTGAKGAMTNATVQSVGGSGGGRTLKLTYKGGEQTVIVSDATPVVLFERGSRASLAPGAHVIVYAKRETNGDLTAARISVGGNGSVPPM